MAPVYDPETVNSREAGELIGISAATVRGYARRGAIAGTKVGFRWSFEPREVERFRAVKRKPGNYPGPRGPHRREKQLALPIAERKPKRVVATQPRLPLAAVVS